MADDKRKWPPKVGQSKTIPREVVDITPGTTPVLHSDGAVVARAHGPQAQIVQTNMLSTPALVVVIVGLVISTALGFSAFYISQMAEREARLALAHADRAAMDLEIHLQAQPQQEQP